MRQVLPSIDPSSELDLWPPQPDNTSHTLWQPESLGTASYAPFASSSGNQQASLYPALPANAAQLMQQEHAFHFQQSPPQFQSQSYSQQPFGSLQAMTSMSTTGGFSDGPMSIDETTFNELRAAYPNAAPEMLIGAVFHPPQQFGQQQHFGQAPSQHQPPLVPQTPQAGSYAPSSSHQWPSRPHSDHSLANALLFTTPSTANSGLAQLGVAPFPARASPADVAAPDAATSSSAKEKEHKLRQSKLAFLPGVAKAVSQKETPSPPAPTVATTSTSGASADVTVIADSGSERSTPPLPPAKALVRPSAKNAGAAVKIDASIKKAEIKRLWESVKQPLSRLSVEREPQKAVHRFVGPLSDLDPSGKFRNPRPTEPEDRKMILGMLNSIVNLEAGKGYTEHGRQKFFAALMGSYAARHILSAWLRATTPPKKATKDALEESVKYTETLLPLLNVLGYVEMKRDYLTDDAALGKAITGVSLRAVDSSARKLAEVIKAKWTKVVEDADTKASAPPTRSTSVAPASAHSVKRKPIDNAPATAVEASTKRYKAAPAVAGPGASARTVKPAPAPSSLTANAKAGVDFFATGSVKKPTIGKPAPNASAASSSRTNAHQNIMNLMEKISGGSGASHTASGAVNASSASTQAKGKVKKRVTWKADNELVAVKLIEPADYGLGEEDEEHTEGAGGTHDEGLALKQSLSTMEALIDWREPREVVMPAEWIPLGSESVEGPFQTRRIAGLERSDHADKEKELESPEENHLEQPGSISDTPAELAGAETIVITTPWIQETDPDADATDEGQEMLTDTVKCEDQQDGTVASTITALPSTANLAELLSKVGQTIGANAAAPESHGTGNAAPPPALSFDVSQLQSILNTANGNGANSSTVNAAMASSHVTSDNLSGLLSSLSKSQATGNAHTAQQPSYWHGPQGDNDAKFDAQEESYPGEFQQGYEQERKQLYRQKPVSRGFRYGDEAGWDSEQPSYDGYQYGGARDGGQADYGSGGYNGSGGGGGGWQGKRHTVPCKFFAQGTCRNGASCGFRH